jgi:hypothetical protein
LTPRENLAEGKKAIKDEYFMTAEYHLSAIPKTAKEFGEAQRLLKNLGKNTSSGGANTGASIYKRIAAKTGLPLMFGWRAANMIVAVPRSDWNRLSKKERIDLTYYIEQLVQQVKDNPEPHVRKWTSYYKRTEQLSSGMEYDGLTETAYMQKVTNLCGSCWEITIGVNRRDGFYDEETPVSGSNVEAFRRSSSD